ncbi:similar to Saccharomyces cerevisiae YGR172C YIP1 Integral membrane protein required for the biogenesis of ER-derived COPII transport vesicles [Maudiozyma barnettii]|uniref:Protein YIP n=1 Tax=Maudiozyma barnettii TaxID=61262 RepID=A0A8H2ZHX9_9SACH|nr:transporter YIP1 [Kazachstania barnettii]CAB4255278.1 similar to Saccharomyces cerevisiae YGR172C YIP1 Integral membrane protein required for the biogenesis of ER-derived COPII transport vesicles [Kazachstania barnettii]CAD1783685.1 similar to Saccharomyces cerevisiae YGR172C YIP1 Integral membrane protein required for the biogenesis of ER-derived COPII transport vesicles [Kazachstania barnettii]
MNGYNNNNMNDNPQGFYQPSQQFAFPQGSMSSTMPNTGSNPDSMGLGVAPDPLPMGILNALSTKGYAHEPPLLEELGIHFDHILAKTKIVLLPVRRTSQGSMSQELLQDADLSGPLLFFMLFGLFLLLAGKVHFGYIYGVALFGTVSLHSLSKLMFNQSTSAQQVSLHFFNTASILGYCFLPLCLLTAVGIVMNLDNTPGYAMGAFAVLWATWSASGFLNSLLQLQNARALIAYPLLIFYSVFALMAIFV